MDRIIIKQWAKKNNCEIDNNGLLHAYKAVHKVNTKNGPRYISDYAVTPRFLPRIAKWVVDASMRMQDLIEYKIGETISLSASDFDSNPWKPCAKGLHCSGQKYATFFGTWADACVIELAIDLNDPETRIVVPYEESLVEYMCNKTRSMSLNGKEMWLKKNAKLAEKQFLFAEKFRANKLTVVREVYTPAFPGIVLYTPSLFYFQNQEEAWRYILDILDGKE